MLGTSFGLHFAKLASAMSNSFAPSSNSLVAAALRFFCVSASSRLPLSMVRLRVPGSASSIALAFLIRSLSISWIVFAVLASEIGSGFLRLSAVSGVAAFFSPGEWPLFASARRAASGL